MHIHLQAMLILAVTAVLLTMLLLGNAPATTILAVHVTLIVLIMVVGGAARHLPVVLKIILDAFQSMLR